MTFQALQAVTTETPNFEYVPKDDLSEYKQFNELTGGQPDFDELDMQMMRDLKGE
jgi:hypothetical protein